MGERGAAGATHRGPEGAGTHAAPEERVAYAVAGGVATLTLTRPEKRNALDPAMVSALLAALTRAAGDDAVRAVLLRGEGPDFCAGADLAGLARSAASYDPHAVLAEASALAGLFAALRRAPLPVVAAVHGRAYGGGAGLALACDLIVCGDDAAFAFPEIRLGFVPATVMALVRGAIPEKAAFELLARGEPVGAADALRLGLANRVFPAATFASDAHAYVRELAARPPGALRLMKRLFYATAFAPWDDALARGAEVHALARAADEFRAGVARFLERRERGG